MTGTGFDCDQDTTRGVLRGSGLSTVGILGCEVAEALSGCLYLRRRTRLTSLDPAIGEQRGGAEARTRRGVPLLSPPALRPTDG